MAGDDDDTTFIQLDDDAEPVTRSAFMLHGYSIVESVQTDTPGWISDEWLSAIGADTTIAAAELESVGWWEREGSGYRIHESDLIQETVEFSAKLERTKQECADRGHHRIKMGDDGYRYCTHCLAPIDRPWEEPTTG